MMAQWSAADEREMVTLVKALWRGQVPLPQVFWWHAVGYALLLNLATSVLFLAAVARDAAAPWLVAAFLLPIPYNALIAVAVWRSAAGYRGPRRWAELARAGALAWLVLLTLA